MTSINHAQRTILRSRVRRHDKGATVLPNGTNVSDLKNADLIQAALLLGLDIPTDAEAEAYSVAKDNGANARGAMSAADKVAMANGTGGPGFAGLALSGKTPDADPDVDRDDADTNDVDPTPTRSTSSSEDSGDAERKAKADQAVKEILARMGAGDFDGYRSLLNDLALTAYRPDPEPIVKTIQAAAPIDPAKIKGTVPKVVGSRSLRDCKIGGGLGMDPAKIKLDVYDAPDAPRVDPDYLWPSETGAAVSQLARGRTVFLYGPASTGKTSFAKQIAANWTRPYVRISCNEETEGPTLTGMTVPDASGGVKFQDGQLASALRRPGTVVHIDEVTSARAGALFVMHGVLDEERALHVAETGEVIPLAPGVMVIISDNTNGTGDQTGQYESTRIMNRAFLDRAGVTIRLDYMTPDREALAIQARTGCSKETAAKLAKLAAITRRGADDGKLSHGLTLRRLIALAELITDGCAPAAAYQIAVIETAPHDDKETLRQIWTAEMKG
jgi:MoxR-like ATPase